MSARNEFLNSLMGNVTSSIFSGGSLHKNETISADIRNLIREEAARLIPNAVEKESKQILGTIRDPETGWTFEALTNGNGVSAANQLGSPIMDYNLYRKIQYPRTDEEKELAAKVKAQDRDWTEDLYSPEYLKSYQEQKAKQIEYMFSNENNPMKNALISGLPVSVVARSNPLAAAMITSKDFLTLQVNNNLVDQLGMVTIIDVIFQLFQSVSTPNLIAKYWLFGDIEVEKNVPEGKIIETTKTEVEEVKYKIGKNVGGVSATWESQLVITQGGDPYGMITGKIANKLAQARNEMKANTIEQATTFGGADMGALTGDRSTNDPVDSFQPVLNTIRNNKVGLDNPGRDLVLISGSKALMKFNTNTFTKGMFTPNGNIVLDRSVVNGQRLFPMNVTWATTDLVSATKIWISDPRAVPNFIGPNQRSEWFDQRNLSKATYYFDAVGDAIIDTGSIREMTTMVT